jgi:HSP20 family molecular chaperone IbpA
MNTERQYGWMWAQACELMDRAERLQRQFLRYLGPGADAAVWEPPVDIQESEEGWVLVLALPGVALEDIDIRLDASALTVKAVRPVRLMSRDAVIRRLEIPHGHFVRQIAVPGAFLTLAESRYVNGCLEVRLLKTGRGG